MDDLRRDIQSFTHRTKLHSGNCVGFLSYHLKPIAYGLLLSLLSLWRLSCVLKKFSARPTQRASSPDLEKPGTPVPEKTKASERQFGTWSPVEFKRPTAKPYPDWDVHTTRPLPYRPFRHGKYHITMGLRSMKWDDWIELDNHYLKYHADKARRIEERGVKCNRTAPEAFDGAVELLEEL